MTRVSVIAPLGEAFDTVKRVLFRPFNALKWFGMGFTAWLAMLYENFSGFLLNGCNSVGQDFFKTGWRWFQANALLSSATFLALFVLACSLLLVVAWVSARGRFMFLDNVVNNRGEVAAPWNRWSRQGNSYFIFSILFGLALVVIVFLAGVVLVVAGPGAAGLGWDMFMIVAAALGLILAALALLCISCIYVFLDDFVVPIMLCRACGVMEAWGVILELLAANIGVFVLYLLFKLVVVIAVGLGAALLLCATCCLAFVPYIGTVIMLPFLVFMRSYPLHFLEQFGDSFRLFVAPAPAVEGVAEWN